MNLPGTIALVIALLAGFLLLLLGRSARKVGLLLLGIVIPVGGPVNNVVRFLFLSGDMMKTSHIALSVVIFFLIAISAFGQTPSDSHLPVIEDEGFGPVASGLKGKTLVPLAIPSSLPNDLGVDRFFCTIISLEPNEYEVIIGWDAECGGGNACRVGSFYGKRSEGSHITGSRNYPFERRRARRVRLREGITGYFVDATCGANCSDSKLFWKQGGYEYMVGLKLGKMTDVVELANSAIRNSR